MYPPKISCFIFGPTKAVSVVTLDCISSKKIFFCLSNIVCFGTLGAVPYRTITLHILQLSITDASTVVVHEQDDHLVQSRQLFLDQYALRPIHKYPIKLCRKLTHYYYTFKNFIKLSITF